MEFEIKDIIQLTLATKKITIWVEIFKKYVQYQYEKMYKTPQKYITIISKWRNIICSQAGRQHCIDNIVFFPN